MLCNESGLQINNIEYDADEFSFWASEEYTKGICLSDQASYTRNRKKSIFTKKQIRLFRKEIQFLNKIHKSDNASFYMSNMP